MMELPTLFYSKGLGSGKVNRANVNVKGDNASDGVHGLCRMAVVSWDNLKVSVRLVRSRLLPSDDAQLEKQGVGYSLRMLCKRMGASIHKAPSHVCSPVTLGFRCV
jgi:hypothetical protein